MIEHFDFYDNIIITYSIDKLIDDYVQSDTRNGLKTFDSNNEECVEYILMKCSAVNSRIMNALDNALFVEQPDSERKFKIEFTLARIRYYLGKISSIPDDNFAINLICDSLSDLEFDIENRFDFIIGKKGELITNKSKIQWLENTNVLTTLFYDMLNGQNKGKSAPIRQPMIKSTIKDIARLINENFIDVKGNPIPMTTLSDYLSKSEVKEKNKLQKGFRIEL